jgi:uncharacterized BrkB/YihY/UPF0761 family membrane protein
MFSTFFLVLMVLVFCFVIATSITSLVYYKKIADDGGSENVTVTTANWMFGLNIAVAIASFVLLVYFVYTWIRNRTFRK